MNDTISPGSIPGAYRQMSHHSKQIVIVLTGDTGETIEVLTIASAAVMSSRCAHHTPQPNSASKCPCPNLTPSERKAHTLIGQKVYLVPTQALQLLDRANHNHLAPICIGPHGQRCAPKARPAHARAALSALSTLFGSKQARLTALASIPQDIQAITLLLLIGMASECS